MKQDYEEQELVETPEIQAKRIMIEALQERKEELKPLIDAIDIEIWSLTEDIAELSKTK